MVNKKSNADAETASPRLAYSMEETAALLGVSYQTVWRLSTRGMIRSSSALRHKLFARTEIERFLRDTMQPGGKATPLG